MLRSGVERTDGDHDGIEHVEGSGHQRLERGDHLGRRWDRILRAVRGGGMAAATADGDAQDVRCRHQRSGPGRHHPAAEHRRRDVQREGGVDPAPCGVEYSGLDHVPGTVVAFFPGLEHEHDVTGERCTVGAQQSGSADQHRGVQVVATRMHHVAGCGEVEAGLFPHR